MSISATRSEVKSHKLQQKLELLLVVVMAVVTASLVSRCAFLHVKTLPVETVCSSTKGAIGALETYLLRFKLSVGALPTTEQGLRVLTEPTTVLPPDLKIRPQLKPEGIIDAWGHPFRYRLPGTKSGSEYDLWSAGADGIDGTKDDEGNW